MFVIGSGQNEQSFERTFYRYFLPSFKSSHCLWQGKLKTIIWPWGQRSRLLRYATPPYGHAPTYLNDTIQKTIIWPSGQRSRFHKGQYGMRHTTLWSCTHRQKCYGPDKKILFKKFIWPWGQRSRSHEGHYGIWHTLWPLTLKINRVPDSLKV